MSQALFWGHQDEVDKVPALKKIITLEMFFPIHPADERPVILKAQSCHTSFRGFSGLAKVELPLCLFLHYLEQCKQRASPLWDKELMPEFKSMYYFFYWESFNLKMSAELNNVLNNACQ